MFYCPNCKSFELNHTSYKDNDFIFTNIRDGHGSFLHYVICKKCEYPLSAVVNKKNISEEDEIEYYKQTIEMYQNGEYQERTIMLQAIRDRYEKDYLKALNIVNICDKFKDDK